MNHYENQFLNIGLENFYKSGNSYSEIQPKNSGEFKSLWDAATYLFENGYLIPHSENIVSNTVDIVPNETEFRFELTEKGLSEAKAL